MPLTKIQSLGITDGTIVNADINASAAIASTKLTGVNDAKAWVNFNGTGSVAIRGSFNVSSITDNGTGDYTVNFTTALTDVNYSVFQSANFNESTTKINSSLIRSQLTTACSVATHGDDGPTTYDCAIVTMAVFR